MSKQILNSSVKHALILKHKYDSIEHKYDSLTSTFQEKVDSIGRTSVTMDGISRKMDSLNQVKAEQLRPLRNTFDSVKSNTLNILERINIPPEFKSMVEHSTSAINELELSPPTLDLYLPITDFHNSLNLAVPDLSGALTTRLPNLDIANIPASDEISETTSQLQELNQSMPKDLPTTDQLGQAAETQLGKIDEITAVQDQMGNFPTTPITSEEQVKQELLKQAKEAVTDHFAGREQELKSAMGEISKYKKKFHNVNNLEELAALIKKRPNEMRGKPLAQRIVPGIAFQIQKKDNLLFVDFNPYLGYRFTGRLSAGAGWNERVTYNLNDNIFESESRIFGPRIFSEFRLWRGFSPRLEAETMNTFVPPYINTSPADVGQREWVWGLFAGIKKDYKFFKKINGTALVMFRLFDPDRKSPYADVVNARFGFEFPVKKKVKTPK